MHTYIISFKYYGDEVGIVDMYVTNIKIDPLQIFQSCLTL